tara:strand:- start:1936 stop:2622 length:687 start_codon:yes stop_codon:yes gene_type:complete
MDAKLQEILLDYGLEGYGLYWYCLELIAGNVEADKLTFELEHDARIIARNTGSTVQKVEEMMSRFASLGLFERVDGVITCLKLSKVSDDYTSKMVRLKGTQVIDSKEVRQTPTNSDKVPLDKTKLDETKPLKDMSTSSPVTQEKKPSKQFIKPTPEELVAYFESKGSTSSEAENFFNFYESKGWLVGKNKMKVWKASASLWIGKNKSNGQQVAINNNQSFDDALKRVF